MNCQLCQEYLKSYSDSATWIYCEECENHSNIRYVAHSIGLVVIGFTMDGQDLDWVLVPKSNQSYLRRIERRGRIHEDVLDFPFLVVFNPDNIIERTRTYLVFS